MRPLLVEYLLGFDKNGQDAGVLFRYPILEGSATLLILFSLVLIFGYVPDEVAMGAVQRVFYFHVASAFTAYFGIGVLFLASLIYLTAGSAGEESRRRKEFFARLIFASVEVSFLLCSIVLISGMIWGHSAWNTWWRWEPRLVSFLVLWLILFSQVVMQKLLNQGNRGPGEDVISNFQAVLGIISALNVPIVIYSVKLLDQSQKLHPEVLGRSGLKDARFVETLLVTIVAILVLAIVLMLSRLREYSLRSYQAQIEVLLEDIKLER